MSRPNADWALLDAGPPEQMGMEYPPRGGHYEKHFGNPEEAAAEAQRLADERRHVIRVIANFFPKPTK